MMYRHAWWLLLPVLTLHCTLGPAAPPLPPTVHTVAILPPHNRTGDVLLIEGASWWDPEVDRPGRVTVPDVLVTEIRQQLEGRGVRVLAPEAVTAVLGKQRPHSPEEAAQLARQGELSGSVLYVEIRRWEADNSPLHPQRILVALEAHVFDTGTGRTVWVNRRPLRPVPTPGAATRWRAYLLAARQVAAELYAP